MSTWRSVTTFKYDNEWLRRSHDMSKPKACDWVQFWPNQNCTIKDFARGFLPINRSMGPWLTAMLCSINGHLVAIEWAKSCEILLAIHTRKKAKCLQTSVFSSPIYSSIGRQNQACLGMILTQARWKRSSGFFPLGFDFPSSKRLLQPITLNNSNIKAFKPWVECLCVQYCVL